MKLWVLPPHRDVTWRPEVPEGWRVLDVARDFCRRVFSPESVEEAARAREGQPATPATMRELLLLRAAQALGAREQDTHRDLRRLGAVLAALSGAPHGVHVRLDDVELEGGTTERSADVLRVARTPAAFAEDLSRVAEEFAKAERVRVWLEKDLQLPATVMLVELCPKDVPLEVAGPFAMTHRQVLARLPGWERVSFPESTDGEPPRGKVSRGLAEALADDGASDWRWIPESTTGGPVSLEAATTASAGMPWAGHVPLASLLHPEGLIETGCRVAVVGFCAIDDATVLGIHGERVSREALARALERLVARDVGLWGEWWVGAPGVDEGALDRTLEALGSGAPLSKRVAGVRPFHWTRGREGTVFDGHPVTLREPEADRDLWRSHPFDAPGTVAGARLPEVLQRLAARLLQQQPLLPGRIAAACLPRASAPSNETVGSVPRVRMDPDCALVLLPAALDGTARPTWYAANLRTGGVLAVDARLAPSLSKLDVFTPISEALGSVPEAQRAKWVEALSSRAVLEKERG